MSRFAGSRGPGAGWVDVVLATVVIAALTTPAAAIVVRHDRDDARYRALGKRFPAAVSVLPDGSGVVVAPRWVLTAAHVARGAANRSPRVEVEGREYEVDRIVVHPEWKSLPHDIALFRLVRPVSGVTPVDLYAADDEVGKTVTFVGRGDFGTGLSGPTTADREKRGATNVIDRVDDDWIYFRFDGPDEDTATDLEGVSGPGDSGGPALIERDGKIFTVGVSVFADGDGGPGRYGVIEGYTRVSTHRDWILDVIAGKPVGREIAMGPATRPRPGPDPSDEGRATRTATMGGESAELPDTAAGALVRRYVDTYNRNEDAAMEEFIEQAFSAAYHASRTEGAALKNYRKLFDEYFGRIELMQVREATDEKIAILCSSERGRMAEFHFEFEPGPDPRLAGLEVALVDIDRGP